MTNLSLNCSSIDELLFYEENEYWKDKFSIVATKYYSPSSPGETKTKTNVKKKKENEIER